MTDAIDGGRSPSSKGWLTGLALRVSGKIRNRIEIWRGERRLLLADDAMLRDIGVSRCGIERLVRHGRSRRRRYFPE